MKALLAAVALAIAATAVHAENGTDLLNNCGNAFTAGFANRGACHGVISGYAEGLYYASRFHVCLEFGVNDQQLVMVVQSYLRAHPERLNRRAGELIGEALSSAFPCR